MASNQGVLTLVMTMVLMGLPLWTYGLTLHVRPTSTNTSCPTYPCHTLSEYAKHPGQYFSGSNLTLQFLPGNHTVYVNVTITRIYQLVVLGNIDAVIPTRIVCSSNVGFAFMNISKVRIDGLAFVACSRSHGVRYFFGLYLQSIQTAEIINCTFQDSYHSALGIVNSHVVMRMNNSFISNCRMCSNGGCKPNPLIPFWHPWCLAGNCENFRGPTCLGGGVYLNKSNLSFTGNNNFIGNSATLGGGMYSRANSSMNISGNTTFIDNSASDGGGLYLWSSSNVVIGGNTLFLGNTVRWHGGAVYATGNSYMNISENTTFIANSADYGGGVYSQSNMDINGNTTLIGNSANVGGGVYARSNTDLGIIENTKFINNTASDHGGGVYAGSNSSVDIGGNTNFVNNSARHNGGGVYAQSNTKVTISGNTTFISNSASDHGGEFYIGSVGNGGGVFIGSFSTTNITENTNFFGNSATYGGGVCIDFNCKVYICGNTTFIGNSAVDGGGVHSWANNYINIDGNTTFIGNSAVDGGGGVSSWFRNNVNIIGNTTFIGNSARRNGGGVCLWAKSEVNAGYNSIVSIFGGGEFYSAGNNRMKIKGSTTFNSNSAHGKGGGVYAGSSNSVKISGSTTFSSNSATHGGGWGVVESYLSLEGNSSFTNCSATLGGAIYVKNTKVKFSGTNVFNANRAVRFGGGLYAPKCSLNLHGYNTFITNSAGTKGGGMYVQQAKISFSGTCLFSDNMALLDGGGIYADGSNLNFNENLTIKNNTARLGGGMYSDNNSITIDGYSAVERNVATYYGGGIYTQRSPLTSHGKITFIANSAGEGGGMYATANSLLSLKGLSTFIGNRAHVSGGGIWLDNSELLLNGSNYFVECVASYEGGAIFTYAAIASLHGSSTFESNSATTGGGIHIRWSIVSIKNNCIFKHNNAVFGGGIFSDNSTFNFNHSSTFKGNQASYTGGGIYAARSVLIFLGVSSLTTNKAARDGGAIYTRDGSVVNLFGLNKYQDNSAGDTGGSISAFQSSFNFTGQSIFNGSKAVEGGGFYAANSHVNFPGENIFIGNTASSHGGGFNVISSTLQLNGSATFIRNSAASGGGMYIDKSRVGTDGSNCYESNMANSGGGVYARNSAVKFYGKDMFVANSARSKGAAVHISFTNLIFQGSSSFVNNSAEYGGGIYSESSNVTFLPPGSSLHARVSSSCKTYSDDPVIPQNSFVNNIALRGGGQYFDLYSNCSLDQTAHVHFQDNYATEFGGAIYAADVPGPSQYLSKQHVPFRSECFFYILSKKKSLNLSKSPLVFQNNSAGMRGSVLYGGLLEKCTLSSDRNASALELFTVSILHGGRKDDVGYTISSDPTQLCFCNKSELSCEEVTQSKYIYPGQQVLVSVVAIDQSGSAIPTLIHTDIRLGQSLTLSETISYETEGNCTSRNYSITPNNFYNQLELHPTNRSGSTIHLTVNITFEKCPIGFERSNFSGECICDHRIWQYTNSCDIDKQAILRNASRTFWLSVSYNNGTPEGFTHHRYCPLDYCTSRSKHINLNNPDKQCNYNRSGLLCGKCKEGLSLVLGSSQCEECSNNYLALLIAFLLAGVFLLIFLFLLHLTVAAGTLHGLIFYANIVAANHYIFFPNTSNNPANIFIAWLNLDLGIQTCFYNGLDAYTKAWLEFVFPVYIWVIVGSLVYISHHSITMTKLLGSSPVPVLATLFLLSYAKILRTIIAALSLTSLHYPHKSVVVWIHDANVPLAKYIPLVLTALLFLLFLFLPYTLLLLAGQWLQPKSHLCLLSWVKSPKVKAILDTYHAPYKPKHRYWTGLLLLLRCALFIVFAFNASGDDSINLLATSSTILGILGWFTLSGVVYKNWYLNAIEVSFILNLGILSAATYHVNQSGGSQAAVAYTSVCIAFLTFVGIVTYHVYVRIKSKVGYIKRGILIQHRNRKLHVNHANNNNGNPGNLNHQPRLAPTVTHTEVNLHELRSPLDLLSYHEMN